MTTMLTRAEALGDILRDATMDSERAVLCGVFHRHLDFLVQVNRPGELDSSRIELGIGIVVRRVYWCDSTYPCIWKWIQHAITRAGIDVQKRATVVVSILGALFEWQVDWNNNANARRMADFLGLLTDPCAMWAPCFLYQELVPLDEQRAVDQLPNDGDSDDLFDIQQRPFFMLKDDVRNANDWRSSHRLDLLDLDWNAVWRVLTNE